MILTEEKKALEDFKVLRKKTEKRQRENANRLENQPRIEPLMKRRRLTPSRLENKWTEGELDLGKWLARDDDVDSNKQGAGGVSNHEKSIHETDPCSGTGKHAPQVQGKSTPPLAMEAHTLYLA